MRISTAGRVYGRDGSLVEKYAGALESRTSSLHPRVCTVRLERETGFEPATACLEGGPPSFWSPTQRPRSWAEWCRAAPPDPMTSQTRSMAFLISPYCRPLSGAKSSCITGSADLDGDVPVEVGVVATEDGRHAVAPELFDDPVAPETAARGYGHHLAHLPCGLMS